MSGQEHVWWMVSRAAGLTALVAMTASVILGLALATRAVDRPRIRAAAALHEYLAVISLVAIAVHGEALLGDRFLDPGVAGLLVPFVIDHERVFTAAGVIGGWIAAVLGLTFYARRRLGARRWRNAHRFIVVAWILSVVHTLGAGSDATHPLVLAFTCSSIGVIAVLLLARWLPARDNRPRAEQAKP
jgi:sulfoxide reductase heme-binding subunit YedZ